MFKKFVLILAILGIVALVVSAGTVPGVGRYSITLGQASQVQGTVLKAGDYRLIVAGTKVTITSDTGKTLAEVAAKVETQEKKFDQTVVMLSNLNGKAVVTEIRLGGTKTKLVFEN